MNQIFWQPGITLENLSNQIIKAAFAFYRGNKTQCAQSLGIGIRTLEIKLKKMADDELLLKEGLTIEEFERRNMLNRERGYPILTPEQFAAEKKQLEMNKVVEDKMHAEIEDYNARSRKCKQGIQTYGQRMA